MSKIYTVYTVCIEGEGEFEQAATSPAEAACLAVASGDYDGDPVVIRTYVDGDGAPIFVRHTGDGSAEEISAEEYEEYNK